MPNPFHHPVRRRALCLGWITLITATLTLTACAPSVPQGSPTDQLHAAWDAFRLADYNRAIATFETVIARPDATTADQRRARYGLAITHDLRQPVPTQDNDTAAALYHTILTNAPASDEAAWSLLALARMTHLVPVGETPDYPAVRAAYQSVIEAYPDHLAGHEALIHQQATLILSLDPDPTRRAIDRLNAFLAAYPNSAFRNAAYNLLAQAHETLGNHDAQLEARLRELDTLEIDPDSPASTDLSWRYWQVATTAEFLCGRFDIARDYYQRLINEYPRDFRVFPAKQALARMTRVETAP